MDGKSTSTLNNQDISALPIKLDFNMSFTNWEKNNNKRILTLPDYSEELHSHFPAPDLSTN